MEDVTVCQEDLTFMEGICGTRLMLDFSHLDNPPRLIGTDETDNAFGYDTANANGR